MAQERNLDNLNLDGGWPCLDFINTLHDRTVSNPHDYLKTYEDFLNWGLKTGISDQENVTALKEIAANNVRHSENMLLMAREVREILYQLFLKIARQQKPSEKVVAEFNSFLPPIFSNLSLQFHNPHAIYLKWANTHDLENPLHRVVKSAYDLLCSENLVRIKECKACGWLFLDKSKNNSRRWCNMQTCGSAIKAKRYYRKKKQQA